MLVWSFTSCFSLKDNQKKIQIYDNIFAILESKYSVDRRETSPDESDPDSKTKVPIQKSSLPIMNQVN